MTQPDFKPTDREIGNVLAALDGEYDYQIQKWHDGVVETANTKPVLSVGEFTTLIRRYADKACEEWAHKPGDEAALHELRKVAALTVRCLAKHGAPHRES